MNSFHPELPEQQPLCVVGPPDLQIIYCPPLDDVNVEHGPPLLYYNSTTTIHLAGYTAGLNPSLFLEHL